MAYDSEAVRAGIKMPDAGGDFADGVIALQDARLGGTEFVSFDRKAVRLLHSQGRVARVLACPLSHQPQAVRRRDLTRRLLQVEQLRH